MLTICSYNIHGYNNTKTEYIKALLSKCQILMIQEHWLNGTQLDRFSNTFSCSSMHGKTSIDTSTLLIGRPHGGCCFIYKNYLHSCIKIIPTLSDRFCCVSLTLSSSCIVYMFCVYMPCDNNNNDSLHVYVDILTQISAIYSKYDAEYICIGGDMNTDLVRLQSQNTQALFQFAAKESLQFALNHSISDITHTFTSFAFNSFSTIDHFIVTSSLYQAIKSYTTCDDVMNQSDHLPLFISIDIEVPTDTLDQRFPTGGEFPPRGEFSISQGGNSSLPRLKKYRTN